jgi:DNA-binding SARP family transcriptional activator/TolB-like protein
VRGINSPFDSINRNLPVIHLRLFGGVALERNHAPVTGRPAQSHHLALLAILGASTGRSASRDRLVGYLWPESDTARARHRLSVALHVLRAGLGSDCLITSGDVVALAPEAVWTDVGAFNDAIVDGGLEEAARLYSGPFLEGFHLGGRPGFERWVEAERERFEGLHRSTLARLIAEAEEAGHVHKASEWWRQMAGHAPYRASATIGLMNSLVAAGDLAGALRHARAHVARVEGELGIPANPGVLELAERVAQAARSRTDGHVRVSGAVTGALVPTPLPASSAAEPAVVSRTGGRGRLRLGRRLGLVVATGLALSTAAGFWTLYSRRGEVRAAPGPGVAVLGFVDPEGRPESAALGRGLADAVGATLAYVPGIRVRLASAGARWRTEIDVRRAGRELGASSVLAGSIRAHGQRTEVEARLIDVHSGELLWAEAYERRLHDPEMLVEDLSLAIADHLRLLLVPYEPRRYTESEIAYDDFLAGVYEHRRLTDEAVWKALQHYREAWEADASFALAHAIAGTAYMALTNLGVAPEVGYELGREHVLEALALDSMLAEGHAVMGRVKLWWDRDFEAAERSLRRAIMLYPTHPDARAWYAYYLLHVRRRPEAALESMRLALSLDPLNTARSRDVEIVLYRSRRYEDVFEQSRHTWSLSSEVAGSLPGSPLGDAYRELGRYEESIAEFRALHERRGGLPPVGLAVTYARMGRDEDARAILRRHEAWAEENGDGGVGVARVRASLGEADHAFRWLEATYRGRPTELLGMMTDPALDPLRADPRFDPLLRRMGLLGG